MYYDIIIRLASILCLLKQSNVNHLILKILGCFKKKNK